MSGKKFHFSFFISLVEEKVLDNNALPPLLEGEFHKIADVKKLLPVADVELSSNAEDIPKKLLGGNVLLTLEGEPSKFAFISSHKEIVRAVSARKLNSASLVQKKHLSKPFGKT